MSLPPNVVKDLAIESCISPQVITDAKLSLNDVQNTGVKGEGIAFPYFSLNGDYLGSRVRLFEPISCSKGRVQKYSSAKGNQCNLFFLEKHIDSILDVTKQLIITEGEKKLLSIASIDSLDSTPIVSYPGVYNWTKVKSGGELCDNWSNILFKDRTIKLCPDSDFFENYDVYTGVMRLIRAIVDKGAKVELYDLRINSNTEKIGVDDYIVSKGNEAFKALLSADPYWFFEKIGMNSYKPDNRERFYKSLILLDKPDIIQLFDDFLNLKVEAFKKSTATAQYKKYYKKWTKNRPRPHEKGKGLIWYHMDEDIKAFIGKLVPRITEIENLYRNEGTSTFLAIHKNGKMQTFPRSKELSTFLGNFFSVRKAHQKEGEIVLGPNEYLNEKLLDTLKDVPVNYESVKEVSFVTNTPQLHNDRIISKFGYDEDSKIFYTGKSIEEIEGGYYLKLFLSMFPFESKDDYINVLGLILSFFIINKYKGQHPSIIIQGDKQNLGKTTLAECLSILFQDEEPSTIALTYDEELKKTISSVLQSNNVALIDNIKSSTQGVISSPLLESLITSSKISIRVLGENRMFERPNNALFIFTLNNGAFSPDLSTRSIYISLSMANKSKINFENDPKMFVRLNRYKILGEALYMLNKFHEKKDALREEKVFSNFKFNLWAKEVNKVLMSNAIFGFLENQQHLKDKSDPFRESIENFLFRLTDGEMKFDFRPVEIIDSLPLTVFDDCKNLTSQSMKLSKFFKDNPQVEIDESIYNINKVPDARSGGKSRMYRISRTNNGTTELK